MDTAKEALFEKYQNSGFTEDQLLEIKKGIEEDLDISMYARVLIPASEMAYIRKALHFKKVEIPKKEEEEDFDKIDEEFKEYKESVQVSIYEKVVAFAVFVSGLAIIAAIYAMLMSWPIIK